MKQLLILRHAQALNTEAGGNDKSRKLSPQGFDDARALGTTMTRQDLRPNLALCSTAVRTRQTLEGVMEGLAIAHVDYQDDFYNAPPEAYFRAIQGVSDDVECLLLVGHNPGIHTIAAQLVNEDNAGLVNRLAGGYAPATLSVIECAVESWAKIRPYDNRLMGVLEASEYNGSDRPTRWM